MKLTSLAVLVAALVLPTAASAKGGPIVSLAVCGASGCTPVADRSTFHSLEMYLYGERANPRAAPPIGPYYRLVARVRWLPDRRVTAFFVPGSGITTAFTGSWTAVPGNVLTALTTAAAEQQPASPALAGVDVDAHRVSDTAAYAALLHPLRARVHVSHADWSTPWTYVTLHMTQPVPFRTTFVYVPGAHAIAILGADASGYAVPGGLEDVIRADAGLPALGRGSSRTPFIAAGAALLLAALGVVLVVVRRGRPVLWRGAGRSG
ncbi:MAG: hypothetical protein ACXVYV_01180 [Gaiellales bacterium]